MNTLTATYSPDDNKLRLYASSRLDAATYERVRAAGFRWAPKQDSFIAPMWTPSREDLLIELCGEIGDEDTTLADRAEERAERFEGYSTRRAEDAEGALRGVSAIADNIPLGQPILIGHHSERHARRDAQRIEDGMRKAVTMWKTSEYWTKRAARALRHAKYKERPDVRARRIKTIEAAKRKQERQRAKHEQWFAVWNRENLSLEQARAAASQCWLTVVHGGSNTRNWMADDVLEPDEERAKDCPAWTVGQVQEVARRVYGDAIEWCNRWIAHYDNRLVYERAMLGESGGTPAAHIRPEKGGACMCWASPRGGWSYIVKVNKVSVSVLDNWGNGGANFKRTIAFDKLSRLMSAAQVAEARKAGRLVEAQDGTGFFLHELSADAAPQASPSADCANATQEHAGQSSPEDGGGQAATSPTDWASVEAALKAGVEVVSAPQLFPTPAALAARVIDAADIRIGMRVLEPSAGTGNLLAALPGVMPFGEKRQTALDVVAVELSRTLADGLARSGLAGQVRCADFLACSDELGLFDRVVMNPPFVRGADIAHIRHALRFLRPGGRLVAICANGPRQREALLPLVEDSGGTWEELPEGAFGQAGTSVRTALLTIEAPAEGAAQVSQPQASSVVAP